MVILIENHFLNVRVKKITVSFKDILMGRKVEEIEI